MAGIIVQENGQGRYQQEVIAGEHRLLADEPVSVGGADAGPAPLDFVMAGLGACTSMTLRMYAERKGIPLTRISVSLGHDMVVIDGVKRDRILRKITLDGDLSGDQRARLLEIANKCPVHRALAQPLVIESRLAD
ncbi:MAG: OsmC family protein [Dechloromonas sp.]|jgi:putative redox protein|uniref:OsmC family protein n=1 Tax=Candidatus Dechloromonas phosphorivorans TaxID=2899244 RepID=A0A9D7LPU4_9RHOO|nr:OsmC family protein [Candidatus Dechloromonas phosphorivorans]